MIAKGRLGKKIANKALTRLVLLLTVVTIFKTP